MVIKLIIILLINVLNRENKRVIARIDKEKDSLLQHLELKDEELINLINLKIKSKYKYHFQVSHSILLRMYNIMQSFINFKNK